MARTNNLTDFLTDVSSAIKQKTGDNTPIPASEFDTEILSIETGRNYQSKTLNITQNGNYNLLPDQEFDAISNVNISVSVSPVLQNKTITENGSYTADQNYDGLGTVIVNVPSTGGDTSDATATAEQILKGYTAYTKTGKTTGTFYGAKLFKTVEEMNADKNIKAGDLAVIYNDVPTNIQTGMRIKKFVMPETIVLDEANTSDEMAIIRSLDESLMIHVELQGSSTCYLMGYMPDGQVMLDYSSSDGITWKRGRIDANTSHVTIQDDYLIFDQPMQLDERYDIGKNALKFLRISNHQLLGFNVARNTENKNSVSVLTSFVWNNGVTAEYRDVPINYSKLETFMNIMNNTYSKAFGLVTWDNTNITFYDNVSDGAAYMSNGKLYAGNFDTATATKTGTKYIFNIDTEAITTKSYTTTLVSQVTGGTNKANAIIDTTNVNWTFICTKNMIIGGNDTSDDLYYKEKLLLWVTNGGSNETRIGYSYNIPKYSPAETQLTLDNVNQLYPGVIGFGTDVFVGDGSVFGTMTEEQFLNIAVNVDDPSNNTFNILPKSYITTKEITDTVQMFGVNYENLTEQRDLATISKLTTVENNLSGQKECLSIQIGELYYFLTTSGTKLTVNVYKVDELDNVILQSSKQLTLNQTLSTGEQTVIRTDNEKIYIGAYATVSNKRYPALLVYDIANNTTNIIRSSTNSTAYCFDYDVPTNTMYLVTSNTLYKWVCNSSTAIVSISNSTDTYYNYGAYCEANDTYTAVMAKNYLHIINKVSGAYTKLPVNSTYTNYGALCLFQDNYLYAVGLNKAIKVDMNTLTVVKSVDTQFHYFGGKGIKCHFMLEQNPNIIYFIGNVAYGTWTGGNMTNYMYTLDIDTLECKRVNSPNMCTSTIFMNIPENNIFTDRICKILSNQTYNGDTICCSRVTECNVTECLDGDIPAMFWSNTLRVGEKQKNILFGYTNVGPISQAEYNTAIDTANEILGDTAE